MFSFISRHAIFPLHERLIGRATSRYVRELERSQWESPFDLRRLQAVKLIELLRHARRNVPFYRKRLTDLDLDAARDDPTELLRTIPLLDKHQIRMALGEMTWPGVPGGLVPHNTGGSTGEPLRFYFGRRRQAYDQAARIRTHRWFGVDIGDRELYLWGSPIELGRAGLLKRLRDVLFNQRLLDAFRMSEHRMDAYLDAWDRFRPVCLFGYPSSIALFCRHARARKRELDCSAMRAVFVTGEVCYPHDRETISSYFGVPVADCYGSREAGFIAHECPQGRMHVTAENVIVEILRDGRSVPSGETGEIVVTHLDAYAMPFIRYRTGDVGRLLSGRCSCGRGLAMMDVVSGRSTDFLYTPDGQIKHALSIIYPLREMEGVAQFRVTQHEDFSVTVDIVAEDCGISAESVRGCIRPVLGEKIDVRVNRVDRIEQTASGKFRYVVSHAVPSPRKREEFSCAGA